MKKINLLLAVWLSLVLVACSQNPFGKSDQGIENPAGQGMPEPAKEADPENPDGDQPPVAEAGPNFQIIRSQILQPKCLKCHSGAGAGGVSLDSYDSVVRNLSAVESSVTQGFMPPRGPIEKELQDLLIKWIKLGAPQ
ncbi:MAG: hypothetical protein ACXWC9_04710 [Pseudobdellovibrionaceae bacterium]